MNKFNGDRAVSLRLRAIEKIAPAHRRAAPVNKVFTRIRSQIRKPRYDVRSSLKELRRTAADERMKSEVSRIIPGDWGKAGPGWLAGPLSSRIARSGSGGRIHQFLWRRSRAASNAKKELGGKMR